LGGWFWVTWFNEEYYDGGWVTLLLNGFLYSTLHKSTTCYKNIYHFHYDAKWRVRVLLVSRNGGKSRLFSSAWPYWRSYVNNIFFLYNRYLHKGSISLVLISLAWRVSVLMSYLAHPLSGHPDLMSYNTIERVGLSLSISNTFGLTPMASSVVIHSTPYSPNTFYLYLNLGDNRYQ
jgi:hypothetical protein